MLVQESNRHKKKFTTKWGTYSYCKMSFGLTNIGETFQKEIEIAFKSMLEKFVLVYLDDITMYSKNEIDHFGHLIQVLIKCR